MRRLTAVLIILVIGFFIFIYFTKSDSKLASDARPALEPAVLNLIQNLTEKPQKLQSKSFNYLTAQDVVSQASSLNVSETVKAYSEDACWASLREKVYNEPAYITKFQEQLSDSLNNIAPKWFYMKDTPFKSPPASASFSKKFLSALAYGNFLTNLRQPVPLDADKALNLLFEVHKEDLENSAPLAFMAIIYKQQKKESQVKEKLHLIKTTTKRFDSYLLKINRTIFRSVKTPKDYLLTAEVAFTNPTIKTIVLRDFIIEYKATHLAEQLMVLALNDESVLESIDYSLLDYSVGCGALTKLNPAHKCLSALAANTAKANLNNLAELYPVNLEKNCELNEFDSAVAAMQKALSRHE